MPDQRVAERTTAVARGRVPRHTAPAAVMCLALWLAMRPTWADLTSSLPHDLGDPALNTWILAWQSHALVSSPGSWFDGNIFAGHGSALGYSEVMLPLLVVFAPVYWVSGNAVLAHNVTILAALAFCLATTYALSLRLRASRWASVAAAIAITLSSYTYAHLSHLQLLTLGLFPLGIIALLNLLERRRVRDGVWLGVASFAIVSGCLYYAPAWVCTVVAVVLVDLVRQRGRPGNQWWAAVVAAGATSAALVGPLAVLYLRFQAQANFTRVVSASLSFTPSDLLAPSTMSYAYRSLATAMSARPSSVELAFFPGLLMLSLGIVGLFVAVRALRRPRDFLRSDWMVLSVLALVCLFISLGPQIGSIPTPYRWVSSHLPGFSSIRAPARLFAPVLLVLVLAGAQILDRLVRVLALPALTRPIVVVVVAVELMAPAPRAAIVPRPDVETLYATLATQPAGTMVELPAASLADGAAGVFLEGERMLRSIGHWRPRINGTSGGDPPGFAREVEVYNTFPAAAAVDALRAHGVRYAVLHLGDGQAFHLPESTVAAVEADPTMRPIGRFGEILLVDLQP